MTAWCPRRAEPGGGTLEARSRRGAAAGSGGQEKDTTLTFKAQLRFASPAQREEFTRALREAMVDVIARHTSPDTRDGSGGKAYRLVLGCYAYVPEPSAAAPRRT